MAKVRTGFVGEPGVYKNTRKRSICKKVNIEGIPADRIEITDSNGKTTKVKIQDLNRVDLSHLKSGVYVISIFADKNKWTQKIVKE